MNLKTIRTLFGLGVAAAALLFALMLWDHFGNDGALLVELLVPFVIVALFLIILLALRPTEEAVAFEEVAGEAEPADGAYYDYKGDIHDVIDVEGIGPVYAERLHAAGVETTARLCYEDADALAKRIDVPAKSVRQWQQMAELMKVNGIAKQYAEALVRGGVDGIEALKKGDAEKVAGKVAGYLESLDQNVLGQKVTPKRVQGWQRKAAPMRRVRQSVPAA